MEIIENDLYLWGGEESIIAMILHMTRDPHDVGSQQKQQFGHLPR